MKKEINKLFFIRSYSDGATVGHNGTLGTVKEVGLGVLIEKVERICISEKTKGISNNEAEFKALICAMKEAIKAKAKIGYFYCDSQIIINRANGSRPTKAKFRNERMDKFQDEVLKLAKKFEKVTFTWIPREKNIIADNLSKKACQL